MEQGTPPTGSLVATFTSGAREPVALVKSPAPGSTPCSALRARWVRPSLSFTILASGSCGRFQSSLCHPFYAEGKGRPSIPPGVYMRMLMVGFFEGLDSERGGSLLVE